MSDLVVRLRAIPAGQMFIQNTADKAWQKWMRECVKVSTEAADALEASYAHVADLFQRAEEAEARSE